MCLDPSRHYPFRRFMQLASCILTISISRISSSTRKFQQNKQTKDTRKAKSDV
ncbi:hypothetical protein Drorol1_Dr00013661 [Drosera rotundifolia]